MMAPRLAPTAAPTSIPVGREILESHEVGVLWEPSEFMKQSRLFQGYGIPCTTSAAYHASAINCEPAGFGWQPSEVYAEFGV